MQTPATPATLAEVLAPARVPDAALHQRYGTLLELVRRLLGVVPHADAYLEIWPPGFRSYNLMVPNFLNLPFSVFGFGVDAGTVGLAMYTSSRAAECMYCSAHCCSFAMRRGMDAQKVAEAIGAPTDAVFDAGELAVIGVAAGMASMPATLRAEQVRELRAHFPPDHAGWIVSAVAMMGFLNKAMDMLGVELEEALHDEVAELISGTGWTTGRHRVAATASEAIPLGPDTLGRKLSWVPYLPSALAQDMRWSSGVPSAAAEARALLQAHAGHDFPLLSRLHHPRLVKSLTTMLRDNLDAERTVLGLPTKLLAGLVFAAHSQDAALVEAGRAMAARAGVGDAAVEAAIALGEAVPELAEAEAIVEIEAGLARLGLGEVERAALVLARGGASSPAELPPALLARVRGRLAPEATVELVVWLSVLQLLHRFIVFQAADG